MSYRLICHAEYPRVELNTQPMLPKERSFWVSTAKINAFVSASIWPNGFLSFVESDQPKKTIVVEFA